jgi:acetate kinase
VLSDLVTEAIKEMRVLTINSGSSSLKAGVYRIPVPRKQRVPKDQGEPKDRDVRGKTGAKEKLSLSAEVERIGIPGSRLQIQDEHGETMLDLEEDLGDHHAALRALFVCI